MIIETPVLPMSYADIELEMLYFLKESYPENLKKPTKLDVLSLEDHLFGYKLGLVEKFDDPSILAFTDFDERTITIPLKDYDILLSGKNDNRERFTLAHEAGHVLLHREQFETRRNIAARTKIVQMKWYENPEWQANAASAALLMPLTLFYPQYMFLEQKGISDMVKKSLLASKFSVSNEATQYRMDVIKNIKVQALLRRLGL